MIVSILAFLSVAHIEFRCALNMACLYWLLSIISVCFFFFISTVFNFVAFMFMCLTAYESLRKNELYTQNTFNVWYFYFSHFLCCLSLCLTRCVCNGTNTCTHTYTMLISKQSKICVDLCSCIFSSQYTEKTSQYRKHR